MISQSNQANINYSLNAISSKELQGVSPIEHYHIVNEEVEQVKESAKVLLKVK